MTAFEDDFLLCKTVGFAPTDLFFSSGPAAILEPYSSVMVQSIVEYQTTEIADTISRLPQTKLLHQSDGASLRVENGKELTTASQIMNSR